MVVISKMKAKWKYNMTQDKNWPKSGKMFHSVAILFSFIYQTSVLLVAMFAESVPH